jgi:hypothetical protein
VKNLSGTAALALLVVISAQAQPTRIQATVPANHWRVVQFRPDSAWSLDQASKPGALNLDATDEDGRVEYITVIGKRRSARPRDPQNEDGPITLGAATISSSMDTRLPGRNVLTVTASVPIGAIPGLNVVANMTGVSDSRELRDDPIPIIPAGPPVGLSFKF